MKIMGEANGLSQISGYMYLFKHEKTISLNKVLFVTFLASGDFCGLPITFANSLDPDQDRQNGSPDLNPNSLTL